MAKIKFLQADWHNLLMLNYEVDPDVLTPYLPAGTELDLWQGKALVSMVGFLFLNTRVLGIKWLGHVNFEEVNLRFYVRYHDGTSWKRGAVFVSEIVPKAIIPIVANNLYNEHYINLPMRHSVTPTGNGSKTYLYEWKLDNKWQQLGATVSDTFTSLIPGSAEEFIFEHYWGYNRISDSLTLEYAVEHVTWQIATVSNPIFQADVATLYGKTFVPFLQKPYSAFFANGSNVSVRVAGRIKVSSAPEG